MAARVAVLPHASARRARARVDPPRRAARPPARRRRRRRRSSARSRRPRGLGATGRVPAADRSRSCATPTSCCADLSPPLRLPRHPLAAGALRPARRSARRTGLAARCSTTPRARALLRRARRPLDPAARPPADAARSLWSSRSRPTTSAGRSRAAARRRSPTRWPRSCAPSAARSTPAAASSRSTSCRRRAPCSSTSRHASCSRSPATGCPRATAARSRATATGPGSSRSTGRSTARSRGRRTTCRGRGTVHVGGTLDEIAAAEARCRRRPASPSARSCWSPSRAVFDPTPRPGRQAHRLGLLPRAARLHRRHDGAHRGADRALRARLPRPRPRARHDERARDGGLQPELRRRRHQRRRPSWQLCARSCAMPYSTPNPRLFLCSASTPPGGGVHGMCGYYAAHAALRSCGAAAASGR